MLDEIAADPFANVQNPILYLGTGNARHHRRVDAQTGAHVGAGGRSKRERVVAGAREQIEEECLIPPPASMRWNGLCRYLPTTWAERLRARMRTQALAGAFCLSCGKYLHAGEGLVALAHASDHDREFLNHQIILVNARGDVLARAPYDPLAACC